MSLEVCDACKIYEDSLAFNAQSLDLASWLRKIREHSRADTLQKSVVIEELELSLSKVDDLSPENLQQIIEFLNLNFDLWLEVIEELNSKTRGLNDSDGPTWNSYYQSLDFELSQGIKNEPLKLEVIEKIHNVLVKTWLVSQESLSDDAYLMLATAKAEFQLARLEILAQITSKSGASFFQKSEIRSKSDRRIVNLELMLGPLPEYLKTRFEFGFQLRHVISHSDGFIDRKSREKFPAFLKDKLPEGFKFPLGHKSTSIGTEFFIEIYAALITEFYKRIYDQRPHAPECDSSQIFLIQIQSLPIPSWMKILRAVLEGSDLEKGSVR